MDDSSMFMQWPMATLQHNHQPVAAAYAGGTFPSLIQLHCSALQNSMAKAQTAAQDGHRRHAASSWSSGDSGGRENTLSAVVGKDGWSSNSVHCAPSCSADSTNWNFTSALAQPSINEATPSPAAAPASVHDGHGVPELSYPSPTSRKASAKRAASKRHRSPEPYAEEHVMAERKRREKISRRFIELSSVIPGLKRMDKATILSDAVRYVKEQQEKLKALEEDRKARSVESSSVVLAKKPCIAAADGGGCPSPPATDGRTKTARSVLPEIEARIAESNVMVRIHCEDGKGVLVRLLSEIEGLHLSITHTNVVPFQACTVIQWRMLGQN